MALTNEEILDAIASKTVLEISEPVSYTHLTLPTT